MDIAGVPVAGIARGLAVEHTVGPVGVGFYQTSPIPIVMERKRGDGQEVRG